MDINHIHLAVKDLDKSRWFYSEFLGFRDKIMHGKCLFMTNDDGFDLAIDPEYEPSQLPKWFHFGCRLKDASSVKDLYQKMSHNSEYIKRKLEEYDDFVFFRAIDPDGHEIEIYWE